MDASDAALAGDADVPFVITENGGVFASRDGRPPTDYGRVIAEDAWRRQMEWIALSLIWGSEPSFTLDEEGRFWTLDGRVAISKERLHLRALMGPRTRAIEEALLLGRELWERFLVADDEGATVLEQHLALADEGDVPDTFAMSICQEWTQDEVDDFAGTLKPSALFFDAAEREAARCLTWRLIRAPEAAAMLCDLTRRRDAFVREEGALPTDLPTY